MTSRILTPGTLYVGGRPVATVDRVGLPGLARAVDSSGGPARVVAMPHSMGPSETGSPAGAKVPRDSISG